MSSKELTNKTILITDKELYKDRIDICKTCVNLFHPTSTCKKCGCFMLIKAKLKNSSCPIGKW